MTHLSIFWTRNLRDAAHAVADEKSDLYANTPDVRSRAFEIASRASVGRVLAPHQVDFIQALRSRLDCCAVEPIDSHRQFEAAWSGAYAEALDAFNEGLA